MQNGKICSSFHAAHRKRFRKKNLLNCRCGRNIYLSIFLSSKHQSTAFWSLDTDLQLSYEVYDKSYEINAVLQAIATAASRQYVIASDDDTKMALSGIQGITSQIRGAPISFFNELLLAAASRSNNEA